MERSNNLIKTPYNNYGYGYGYGYDGGYSYGYGMYKNTWKGLIIWS